jgi:hypothetical protein
LGVSCARTTPLPSALVTKLSSWSRTSGLRGGRVDQLHQVHVARRVEEVDAAEARLDFFGQHLGQLGDAQARGVAGHDRVRRHERRDLGVEVELPVHALGNGLDDEVAVLQQLQVLFVVGLLDQRGVLGHAQRRGLELLQAVDGLGDDAVLRAFLGGQVEQHDGHLDVDEVGGDLRAHHAGAEHGDRRRAASRCGRPERTVGSLMRTQRLSVLPSSSIVFHRPTGRGLGKGRRWQQGGNTAQADP